MGTEKPVEGTDTPSLAAGGVSPEMMAEIKKSTATLIRNMLPGLVKQAVTESVPTLLEEIAKAGGKPADDAPDEKKTGESRSLKALETQLNELRQQLKAEKEATQAERNRVIDQQMRGEARDLLSGIVGADNPNLPLVIDSFYDAKKRFVKDENGQTLVRFKAEDGTEEELLPLGSKDTVKRLSTELKHVLPSKTAALPSLGRGRGAPIPAGQTNGKGVLDSIFDSVVSQAASAAADPTQK